MPTTISAEAAEIIRTMKPSRLTPMPKELWLAAWELNEKRAMGASQEALKRYPAKIEKMTIAGSEHLLVTPSTYDPENHDRIVVYLHGGGYSLFSPESSFFCSLPAAHYLQAKVLAIRYPLAWQEPFPAARDYLVSIYHELMKTYAPENIAMLGDSAGGGLIMSSVLELRDQGVPMPSVLGLISPWADVTKTGDSQTLLAGADPLIDYERNIRAYAQTYADGKDMKDPGISPLYADFTKGFPPSYISTGTRDLILSQCAQLQRKLIDAGVENHLVIYEGMWHDFQAFRIPEEHHAWRDMTAFIQQHWGQ